MTNAQIADALTSQYGVPVDKKDLKMEDTVKQTGEYKFKVRLMQAWMRDDT